MSFMRVTWWSSSAFIMLFTFFSAESYFVFKEVTLLSCFLKNPTSLLSSSSTSKLFSSFTTPESKSPTSPRSLVLTLSRVFSEKLEIFLCAPIPYCKTIFEFVMSMVLANSSTCFSSSGLNLTSFFSSTNFISCTSLSLFRSSKSSVKDNFISLSILFSS